MLHPPTRFLNLPLAGRHGFESMLVEIENSAISAVADRVRLDLNATAQRLFKHWPQLVRFLREETGSVGFVRIRREQCRAARTERTIKNDFDRALGETVIECIQGRAIFQQCACGLSGAILSRSARVGNWGGFQNVSIQPRPVIHLLRAVCTTRSLTFARKSSRVFVPSRFKVTSRSPIPKI